MNFLEVGDGGGQCMIGCIFYHSGDPYISQQIVGGETSRALGISGADGSLGSVEILEIFDHESLDHRAQRTHSCAGEVVRRFAHPGLPGFRHGKNDAPDTFCCQIAMTGCQQAYVNREWMRDEKLEQ